MIVACSVCKEPYAKVVWQRSNCLVRSEPLNVLVDETMLSSGGMWDGQSRGLVAAQHSSGKEGTPRRLLQSAVKTIHKVAVQFSVLSNP